MADPKEKSKNDPFKTRSSKDEVPSASGSLNPPPEISEAIDQFRQNQDQAKHFEGQATIYKDQVQNWAFEQFLSRSLAGVKGSFKVEGDESMVTYVTMDSSAGLTEDDVSQIASRFGDKVADDLVTRDFRSIRFDPEVLASNYDAVVEALQVLPDGVLSRLFKPMLLKAKPGAVELAKQHAKDEEELGELLRMLKMKYYIR